MQRIGEKLYAAWPGHPPDARDEYYQYYKILGYMFPLAAAIHSVFLLFFAIVGVAPMYYFNYGSCLLFLLAIWLNRRGHHYGSLALALLEVQTHGALSVYYLGQGAGFQYYSFVVALLVFMGPAGRTALKTIFCLWIAATFIGVYYLTLDRIPPYVLSQNSLTAINIGNIVGAFFLVATGAFYYNHVADSRLHKIRTLINQQEGDYFLTGLLLKPLIGMFNTPSRLQIDYLIRQKKSFNFQGRIDRIGGDFCMADYISLGGRRYAVFANGDAMGKSLQGAGGALVFGALFKALLMRTRTDRKAQDASPEIWLANCYNEMQTIFCGFEGYMQVSALVGLADEENHCIYYFNADHPRPVLLSGSTCEYLDEYSSARLGVRDPDDRVVINVRWLGPKDAFVIGSDGRDDISVGSTGAKTKVISADLNIFLNAVRAADGRLPEIERRLDALGELIDDLSLLSVRRADSGAETTATTAELRQRRKIGSEALVQKDYARAALEFFAAREIAPEDAATLRGLGQALYGLRRFEEAAAHFVRADSVAPHQGANLYFAALAARHAGDLYAAAELGERFRLRAPDHLHNLANLAETYRRLEDSGRAQAARDEVSRLVEKRKSGGTAEKAQLLTSLINVSR